MPPGTAESSIIDSTYQSNDSQPDTDLYYATSPRNSVHDPPELGIMTVNKLKPIPYGQAKIIQDAEEKKKFINRLSKQTKRVTTINPKWTKPPKVADLRNSSNDLNPMI